METKQLIEEILKHEELHNLITHLGDFKEAVEGELEGSRMMNCEHDTTYWERQLKVVNRLIEVTKGDRV